MRFTGSVGVVGVFVPADPGAPDDLARDKAMPSWLVSHQLPLTIAPDAYEHFDRQGTGRTKVVLSPVETNGGSAR
jgi:threonine dehydrogenase-like Zn-dependent dehydrogenase